MKRKYSRSFAAVIVVFLIASALTMTCLAVRQEGRKEISRNFTDNINTRVIEVSADSTADPDAVLGFSDASKIRNMLSGSKGSYTVMSVYDLGFGMQDSEGRTWFLYGIDEKAEKILGTDIGDDCGIFAGRSDNKEEKLELEVPVVEVKNDGFESSETRTMIIDAAPQKNKKLNSIMKDGRNCLYVNEATYGKAVTAAFGMDFDTFRREYDEGNDFGIVPVKSVFVYCSDIGVVEQAAEKIEKRNYDVAYTLQAFDDLPGSVGRTSLMLFAVAVMAYIVSIVILAASYFSQFRGLQKDMGILRHMGFSAKQVRSIYSSNISGIMLPAAVFDIAFSAVVSYVLTDSGHTEIFAGTAVPMLASVAFVGLISWIMLGKFCRKDILTLVRFSKDSE